MEKKTTTDIWNDSELLTKTAQAITDSMNKVHKARVKMMDVFEEMFLQKIGSPPQNRGISDNVTQYLKKKGLTFKRV